MLPEPNIIVGAHDFDSEIDGLPADLLGRKTAGIQLSGFACPQKVGRHRRLAQLQPQPDLPHRETLLVRQP